MINYRVDDLDQMLEDLGRAGVQIIGGPDADENGKFAWILDPDGNKVELWQPMVAGDKNEDAASAAPEA
jgi:predicted enzyme related to lactoylglutathione lyase